MKLSISIVTYKNDLYALRETLASLESAFAMAKQYYPDLLCNFFLIDNEKGKPSEAALTQTLARMNRGTFNSFKSLGEGINLGYGGGHNLCLTETDFTKTDPTSKDGDYHLILNPDVILDDDALWQGISFLEEEKDVVMLAPHAVNKNDKPLYLCKRYPSVFVLFMRGFFPKLLQKIFTQRLAHYEMQDLYQSEQSSKDVPLISGCCMLIRSQTFKKLNGFNEQFFLYFEDYDLSLRAKEKGLIAYNPEMLITHLGGFSAKKGFWHIKAFIKSATLFFNLHGWRWF